TEQDEVDEDAADRLVGDKRIFRDAQPKHDAHEREARDHERADVVHDAARASAQLLGADRHGEPDRALQGELGYPGIVGADVAGAAAPPGRGGRFASVSVATAKSAASSSASPANGMERSHPATR